VRRRGLLGFSQSNKQLCLASFGRNPHATLPLAMCASPLQQAVGKRWRTCYRSSRYEPQERFHRGCDLFRPGWLRFQALSERVVPRIRALVLVPTRELVQQVAVVMKPFCGAAKLTLLAISGSHSFLAEQAILVPTGPFVVHTVPYC
jgi:hypothetical protein